jgi:hypothetical protein
MFKHLTHNISPLIKLSFNTPKSTRDLDALLKTYPASRKPTPNHDRSTYTSGEQEQLIEL